MRYKRALALVLALAMALTLAGCGEEERHDVQVVAMDTVMSLTAYGSNGEAGLDAATAVINALDAMLDPERQGSAVYNLNNSQGTPVSVTGQIAEMLSVAGTVYTQSNGALDLTVYPLVKAWGFIDAQYRVPSDSEIAGLLANVGFDKVSINRMSDADTSLVTLPSGTELSFASVAKGCAAKYAAQAMANVGVTSAIISLGGNVQTLGLRPDGSNWNVAVQDPENTNSYVGILAVGETAVVTSGGYQRYFVASNGTTYQHIIDPSTGRPADTDLLSVTIVCEDGTMADALSTALYVLGESGAKSYYETYGTDFDMVLVTDDGRIAVSGGLTDAFEAYGDRTVEYVRR